MAFYAPPQTQERAPALLPNVKVETASVGGYAQSLLGLRSETEDVLPRYMSSDEVRSQRGDYVAIPVQVVTLYESYYQQAVVYDSGAGQQSYLAAEAIEAPPGATLVSTQPTYDTTARFSPLPGDRQAAETARPVVQTDVTALTVEQQNPKEPEVVVPAYIPAGTVENDAAQRQLEADQGFQRLPGIFGGLPLEDLEEEDPIVTAVRVLSGLAT